MLLGSSPSNWLARREHLARRTQIKHGQQFHSRHAEILQIRNLLNQPGIRAALRGIDAGIWTSSEAGDVQFVNHGAHVREYGRRNGSSPFPIVAAYVGNGGMSSDSGQKFTVPVAGMK